VLVWRTEKNSNVCHLYVDKFAQSSEMLVGAFFPREILGASFFITLSVFLLLKSFKRIYDKPIQETKVWRSNLDTFQLFFLLANVSHRYQIFSFILSENKHVYFFKLIVLIFN
jgi:hypothetical protein